ncbi:MAG: gamma-glutamylcyclotransferase [Spirosomataceae bacterium]
MKTEEYLFVYGTLLSEYGDKSTHELVDKYGEFMGKATMEGKLYMVDYYPGVVPCMDGEKYIVKGELYKIKDSEALFKFLDRYEEYNPVDPEHSEYVRKLAKVKLKGKDDFYDAWVYYFNQPVDDLEFLPKGDFMNEYHK